MRGPDSQVCCSEGAGVHCFNEFPRCCIRDLAILQKTFEAFGPVNNHQTDGTFRPLGGLARREPQ